ncbi:MULTISPECIES: recombinase family protein [Kocuria]|uniref:Invertase n=1 Tax=Kocuria marina TaxID=223184 RepID=A0A0B0DDL5_9MICC|nr:MULTISPECIES: recombinase family protein [Kocuria]KHE73374.1 invertase [Kocuria marina]QIR68783.1 recombinase family protein [Kocuria sp. KD4]GHD86002.1 resolvase [Kocuria marina]
MASLGYARVSTVEQNADLQTRALKDAGCQKVYTDHGVSGTKAKRPQLDKLLEHARAGDEVVVWKLDRLGRNTRQLLELIDRLESQGINFRSLTEGIATTGPMGKAMLTVMSAFAQLERDQLAERTKAGLAAAAARGRRGGRPAVTPETERVRQAGQYRHAGLTPPEIAKLLGVSRATVYRYLALASGEASG